MKKHFTVIELVVVIAVVLVLLSLLQPSLGRMLNQSREVICANNLAQNLKAMEFELEEGVEDIPPGVYMPHTILTTSPDKATWKNRKHWPGILSQYLGSNYTIGLRKTFTPVPGNFFCPHDEVISNNGEYIMEQISYGYNSTINWNYYRHNELTFKDRVPDLSKFVIFADSDRNESKDYSLTGTGTGHHWSYPGFMHDNRTMAGYGDLHVEPRYEFEILSLGKRN